MKEIDVCMDGKINTAYILFKNQSGNYLAVFAKRVGWTVVFFHEDVLILKDTLNPNNGYHPINVTIHNSSLIIKDRGPRLDLLLAWGFKSPSVLNRLKVLDQEGILEFK